MSHQPSDVEAKRALLRQLLQDSEAKRLAVLRSLRDQTIPTVVAVSRDQDLPLSFAQQRLWFLDQLEPQSALYNIAGAIRLRGALATDALFQSLNAIIQRHEALRTTFQVENGHAHQVIGPDLGLPFACHDLKGLPASEREQAWQQRATAEAQAPFDLTTGPLFRAQLIRLGEDDHVLLVTLHHIVADGWSLGVLVQELAALYEAFSQGKPSPLLELPVQYVDFADWQRRYLQGTVLDRQLGYWRDHLASAPTLLELPTDRPRPPVQTHRGASLVVTLPKALHERLLGLANAHGATVYMALLAAFNVLLHRYCHQDDVVVGTPIANRRQAEIEGLIGCFVNTLAIRTDVSGDPSFATLLERVKAATLGAFAHQDLPFEHVVEALQPERSLAYAPVFQVLFVLQNAPFQPLRLPGLTLSPLALEAQTAKFDLTVSLSESDEGLVGTWEYATDLFEPETIARMATHFQVLLEGIVANPDCPVSALPLLSAAERIQQLLTWNATAADYPQDQTVHGLVAVQAARTPDAVALDFQGHTLTYRELDARSNQLAQRLQKLGVGSDVLVGICVERSLEMVIGLLGVLKAGGAYVPLDPSYPAERLAFMLADSDVAVLLIQDALRANLPDHEATVLALDTDWPSIAHEPDTVPVGANTPEDLAYVIYTSGSTGRPKGVAISHRAVCNLLFWLQEAYSLTSADRVLQKTPFSFDVSVGDLFWPLMTGSRLIIAEPGGHQDPTYLANLIQQTGVTTVHFVSSMLQAFLDEPTAGNCASLCRVLCAGEALSYDLQERFFSRMSAQLHNLYGPTEAAVFATAWTCRAKDPRRMVPIGRPIANCQLYLVDRNLQPVPIGVPGELLIGGRGLARGYHNRLELTAEKFIPNPFGEGRLYRTGDLCRYLPDGTVQYLGRIDHQVKVRGYRIELGEIEAVLAEHADIREAVVVAREDQPGDKRLVAYLVAAGIETGEVRDYLRGRLPDYMVPSAFVLLAALPLTPNGKVDRKALPPPDYALDERTYVAPRTPLEATMAAIWSDVLGVDTVGIHDNFFELGGHSLLAVQSIHRMRTLAGLDLPMATLFQYPSIAKLIEFGASQPASQEWSPLVTLQPLGQRRPLILVHPVEGLVWAYHELVCHLGQQHPIIGLQSLGYEPNQEPATDVAAMAATYVAAVLSVQPEGPFCFSGWSFGGVVAYEMAQQLETLGHAVEVVILLDSSVPGERMPMPTDDELRHSVLARWINRQRRATSAASRQSEGFGENVFNVCKSHVQAARDYVPRPFAGPLYLLKAAETLTDNDQSAGWKDLATGTFLTDVVPGNHWTMMESPNVETLAASIRTILATCRQTAPRLRVVD